MFQNSKIYLLFFLIVLQNSFSQKVNFASSFNDLSINSSKNQMVGSTTVGDKIEIEVKIPSKYQLGKFDVLSITIFGTEEDDYPIGLSAKEKTKYASNYNGTGRISLIFFTKNEEILKGSDMDSDGIIKITKNKHNKISGVFEGNIDELRIKGEFKNIKIN